MRQLRKEKILKIVETEGIMKIPNLIKLFNVTKVTIYRDLKVLEEENKIVLTKNGVMIKNVLSVSDFPLLYRLEKNKLEKEIITQKAKEFINNFDSIFLDGSTTSFYLAKLIAKDKDMKLTVLTISPIIVMELVKNRNIEIICTGGPLEKVTCSFIREDISNYFKEININKAFISARGFSIKNGFTEPNKDEANVKKALINYCNEINIIIDSSKYNIVSPYTFGDYKIARRIITDGGLDKNNLEELQTAGVEIFFLPIRNISNNL